MRDSTIQDYLKAYRQEGYNKAIDEAVEALNKLKNEDT